VTADSLPFPLEAAVTVAVGAATHQGQKRSENQDDFLIAELGVDREAGGTLLRPDHAARSTAYFRLGHRGALFVVADGMGGASAGGLASRLATLWIQQEFAALWALERTPTAHAFAAALRTAIERANLRIFQQAAQNPECAGMGSTVTAVGLLDDYAYIGQVGDSRAYLIRNGGCTLLTRDQSMVQALVDAGTMTEEDAERSDRRNVILQALGTRDSVRVDLTYQLLRRGDFLLLCSDGLSRICTPGDMARIAVADPSPQASCETLIAIANEGGGPDNVTVVLARVDGEGLLPPAYGDTVGHRPFDEPFT
jgi:PPM family protein phosphatase